jgi:hypothetical protein
VTVINSSWAPNTKKHYRNSEMGMRKHLRYTLIDVMLRMFATFGFYPRFRAGTGNNFAQVIEFTDGWINNNEGAKPLCDGLLGKIRRKGKGKDDSKCFSSAFSEVATNDNIFYGTEHRSTARSGWMPFLLQFLLTLNDKLDFNQLDKSPILKGGVANRRTPNVHKTRKKTTGETPPPVPEEKKRRNCYLCPKAPQSQGDRGFRVISDTQVEFKPLTKRNTPVTVPVVCDVEFMAFWAFEIVSRVMLKSKRYKEHYPRILDKCKKQMQTAGQADFDIMSVSYDMDESEAEEDGTTVDTSAMSPEKKVKINAIDVIQDIIQSAHKIRDGKRYCKEYKPTPDNTDGVRFKESMMDTMEHFSSHVCNLATAAGLSGTDSINSLLIHDAVASLGKPKNLEAKDINRYVKEALVIKQTPSVKIHPAILRTDLKSLVTAFGVTYSHSMENHIIQNDDLLDSLSVPTKMVVVKLRDANDMLVVRDHEWNKPHETLNYNNLFDGQALWMDGDKYLTSNIAFMTEKRYCDERFTKACFVIWVEKTLMTEIDSILKLADDYNQSQG